jgi:hypothetical protein
MVPARSDDADRPYCSAKAFQSQQPVPRAELDVFQGARLTVDSQVHGDRLKADTRSGTTLPCSAPREDWQPTDQRLKPTAHRSTKTTTTWYLLVTKIFIQSFSSEIIQFWRRFPFHGTQMDRPSVLLALSPICQFRDLSCKHRVCSTLATRTHSDWTACCLRDVSGCAPTCC